MSERRLLVDTAAEIFADACSPHVVRAAEGSWLPELWATLVELGFTTVGVSEEAGGSGGSFADAAAVVRVAASHAAPVPLAETLLARQVLAAAGMKPGSGALTIAAGGDQIRVDRDRGRMKLNGRLARVPWARTAQQLVVVSDAANVVVVVDLEHCRLDEHSSIAGEPRDDVHLDRVEASAGCDLPEALSEERLLCAAAVLRVAQIGGALEHVSGITLEYVNQREQFKRKIGTFQAVQHQIAALAGITAAVLLAAEAAAEAPTSTIAAAAAKAYASHACGRAALLAHELHGAIGFTEEHELQLFTRRMWGWRDEFGSEVYWAGRLADRLIDAGADQTWPLLAAVEQV